jgi:hypothetical protein
VNEPVPLNEPSVEVAVSPPERLADVPQANPCSVASAPPVSDIVALRVAVVKVIEEALSVERVGAVIADVISD